MVGATLAETSDVEVGVFPVGTGEFLPTKIEVLAPQHHHYNQP